MALFPVNRHAIPAFGGGALYASAEGIIPRLNDIPNTGLIWANLAEPPVKVGRMDIEYLKTGIFKDHPIVNRDMGRTLLWGHAAEQAPPIPDLVPLLDKVVLTGKEYKFYLDGVEISAPDTVAFTLKPPK